MEPDWLTTARQKGLIAKEYGAANATANCPPTGRSAWSCASGAAPSFSSEKEFQAEVVALAEAHGWRVAHCRKVLVKQGKRQHYETPMAKGWPDLTLAKPGRVLFLELKFGANTPTDEQKEWGELLGSAPGCRWKVLWPEDWPEIVRLITE